MLRFSTPPCVHSKRLRVYQQNARMLNTCGRLAGTHGGVLNARTEPQYGSGGSAHHHTHHTHTTHHTTHTTHHHTPPHTTTHHHRTTHHAHRTPHTAHRTPHTAHRTPHNAHRTSHIAQRTTHNAQRTTHNAQTHNAQHNTTCEPERASNATTDVLTELVNEGASISPCCV